VLTLVCNAGFYIKPAFQIVKNIYYTLEITDKEILKEPKKKDTKMQRYGTITIMKCPKCFNPLRRVASTEDSVWFTCPLGHRFHSETGSGISDSEGHRYAVASE
jgi:hypothetical protein